MKLKLSLSATPDIRKRFPLWKDLRPEFQKIALTVAAGELGIVNTLEIGIILQSDEELLALNKSALKHDFYTDIITFELERTEEMIESEIYLSIDRAKENAERFGSDLRNELRRLVIHGILHLAGYTDKKPAAKKRMQERERFFLALK